LTGVERGELKSALASQIRTTRRDAVATGFQWKIQKNGLQKVQRGRNERSKAALADVASPSEKHGFLIVSNDANRDPCFKNISNSDAQVSGVLDKVLSLHSVRISVGTTRHPRLSANVPGAARSERGQNGVDGLIQRIVPYRIRAVLESRAQTDRVVGPTNN
jgi:hypothetical protein